MSRLISQDFIQQLLERSNIVEVVSARVNITLKGKDHSGCCPFHQEKTPSFTVSEEKQFYHCFGCGAHGNAINFLIEYNHQSFPEAVEELAAHIGMDVIHDGTATANEPDAALYQLLEQAAAFYQKKLQQHTTAQQYLNSRGVSNDTQQHFCIGYAPNDWHSLKVLGKDTATQALLITNGMIVDREKKYDRFRDRIMFPIRNAQGKVVGFGGRSLGEATPKYLNSPATPIFHKNHELYGLYEARQAQPKLPYVIVVEGYMDVVALAQYQFTMAIATLGTAVNEQHIRKILRYTKRIVYCFDGDRAGQKASWKALLATLPLLTQGVDIKFLTLPQKQDPDSFIRQQGRNAFKSALEQAPRLPEKLFQELETRYPLNHIANQTQFAHEAMTSIQTIPPGFYHDLMIKALAEHLTMDNNALHKLIKGPANDAPKPTKQPIRKAAPSSKIQLKPAAQLASTVLLHHPPLINAVDPSFRLDSQNTIERKMLHALLTLLRKHPQLTTGQLFAHLESTDLKAHLSQLANDPLNLPTTALKAELLGAVKHLQQQEIQQHTNKLIDKAKTQGLSHDEKQQLQQHLMQINENKLE